MDNEYHREYNNSRYARWKAEAHERLGNACNDCGDANGPFHIDHVDPSTKNFDLGKGWARAKAIVDEELDKCQLLCEPCHIRKSISDAGKLPARGTHGTLSAYRYCGPPKCEACKSTKRAYNANSKKAL